MSQYLRAGECLPNRPGMQARPWRSLDVSQHLRAGEHLATARVEERAAAQAHIAPAM